jgi:hypothetical protein
MESNLAVPRDWEVCGTCHELRGRFAHRVNGVVETHVQECRCERATHERLETWHGFDFNTFAELCNVCGCEVLRSGSRYSVWLCSGCKARVLELRAETGQLAVPIGRYFVLPVTAETSEVTAEAIAHRILGIGATQQRLTEWAHNVVENNLEAIGRADDASVPLPEYLDAVRDLDRSEGFDGAVAWIDETA